MTEATEERTAPVPSSWMTPTGRYRRLAGRACDLALAVVVLVAAERYDAGYDMVLGGLMALCMCARRRFPGTVMAAVLGLVSVQFVLQGVPDTRWRRRPPRTTSPCCSP